ncbi:MAG: hypothetical protein ABIY52_03645 [Gemmatimonadaceae bacterium]
MTAFTSTEIVPGVIARLDTQQLRAAGGSETNAQVTDTEDRAVKDARDFLVVAVDAAKQVALCLPLFDRSSPGSAPLKTTKRAGDVGAWLTEDVHYSRWQHWRVPVAAFASASVDEPGEPGARRTYSADDADTLQDLANWATRNRCAFRPA